MITIDVLRRAGADVTVASAEKDLRVDACWGVKLVADALVADVATASFDLISLPVGFCFELLASQFFRVPFLSDLNCDLSREGSRARILSGIVECWRV